MEEHLKTAFIRISVQVYSFLLSRLKRLSCIYIVNNQHKHIKSVFMGTYCLMAFRQFVESNWYLCYFSLFILYSILHFSVYVLGFVFSRNFHTLLASVSRYHLSVPKSSNYDERGSELVKQCHISIYFGMTSYNNLLKIVIYSLISLKMSNVKLELATFK